MATFKLVTGVRDGASKRPAPRESTVKLTDGKPCKTHEWDSVSQMFAWQEKHGVADSEYLSTGNSWNGGESLEGLISLSRRGYPEGVKMLKPARVKADKAIQSTESEDAITRDVVGAFVDVDAAIKGEPECMFDFATQDRPVRRVRIFMDAWVSAGVDAKEIKARGIAIASAALALQAQGIIVDVVRVWCFLNPDHGKLPEAWIQHVWKSGQTYDPSTLALALCHPGWTRVVEFNALRLSGGISYTGIANDNRYSLFPSQPGDVRVVGMMWQDHPWTSDKACESFMAKCLEAANS